MITTVATIIAWLLPTTSSHGAEVMKRVAAHIVGGAVTSALTASERKV